MSRTSRGVGQYVASEAHRAVWARTTKPGAPLCIFCPGSHDTADSTWGVAAADLEALASRGLIVVVLTMGQTLSQGTFGNATAQTRIGQVRTFMRSTSAPLQAGGDTFLVGGSGGVAGALNYARANPTLVAGVAGVVPLVDLQDLYENRTDVSVTQAEIRAAYGNEVPNYATFNPSASGNQAALAGVPIKFWYSTNDPYIPPETVSAYQAKVRAAGGSCEIETLGAVGHADTGLDYGVHVADWLLTA